MSKRIKSMNEIITRRATQGPVVPIPKRVPCRECGRRFEILCDHLSKKHKMMPGQYRERHGLTVDYPLQANEPPAPESAGHRIVEHVKDFSLGLFHGLTCRFELPLPEFSLWALHSTNRQDTKLIFEVWDYCDGSDIDVWVSAR